MRRIFRTLSFMRASEISPCFDRIEQAVVCAVEIARNEDHVVAGLYCRHGSRRYSGSDPGKTLVSPAISSASVTTRP